MFKGFCFIAAGVAAIAVDVWILQAIGWRGVLGLVGVEMVLDVANALI